MLDNALKFTPDGAPVTIKSELLEEGSRRGIRAPVVVVSVRDKVISAYEEIMRMPI